MLHWEKFRDKYLKKISAIMSWVFNIAGLILAVLSFITSDADLGWIVVLFIIAFDCVFLIVVSIYETLLFKRGAAFENDIIQKKDKDIEQLKRQLDLSDNQTNKLRYYYKYIIDKLNQYSKHLLVVYHEYLEANKSIDEISSKCANNNDAIKFNEAIQDLRETAFYNFEQSTKKAYNDFLKEITNELKLILDASLMQKGCMLETSISVKQFNRIIFNPEKYSDVRVLTTFRDNQTYSRGDRKVGDRWFSISKNTDFIFCLTHPYFLKNNIQADDKTYDNENKGFLDYYNCAIVVPIKCKFPDADHIYGYLACDILNKGYVYPQESLLDNKMAEIMEATANIIGLYFDDLDYQWDVFLERKFLEAMYKLKSNFEKH